MDKIRAVIAVVATTATSAALLGAVPAAPAAPRPAPPEPAAHSAGAPWPRGTVRTVGKLVGTYADGQTLSCSGAVVDAPNGSVVVTAAHCVHSPGEPRWKRAWFVPAHHDGGGGAPDAAAAGWRVVSAHVSGAWSRGSLPEALPHDYAFLAVERQNGRTLQEAVGANRLVFEPVDPSKPVLALGYPAGAPYDGGTLGYCAGTPDLLARHEAQPPNVGGLLLEACGLTQGSSGGPWLQDYDPRRQSGTVVAVMSVGDDRGRVLGRPFPAEARRLFAEAAAG